MYSLRWSLVLTLAAGSSGVVSIAIASDASPLKEAVDTNKLVDAHLAERQSALGKQREQSLVLVRQHAWMAYRLGRRRALGFFADTKLRPEAARAAAMAVVVLNRSLLEANKLGDEMQRLQTERALFGAHDLEAKEKDGIVEVSKPCLVWPAKGTIISTPGLKPDLVTGVVFRDTGVQILARVDAPVVSPGAGIVRRVETLPSGGYAVVLAHTDGLVSILSGFRLVDVQQGQAVVAGAPLGRVGRTLDGAPVLRLAVWRGTRPLDPRGLRIWR